MLNRLFVIVGFLVILAIGGAFVIPRFIQWGDYRERLETMGTQAFGAPVTITGDISLTLLPQPVLMLSGVQVGTEGQPAIEVAKVEAEFSLFDFLSDRYKVTRLELDRPVVSLSIGADGTISSGFVLAPEAEQTNVSVADATVVGGRIEISDARSDETHIAESIDGTLRLEALKGPFAFQGDSTVDGGEYVTRVSTGRLDEEGTTTFSLSVAGADRSFTFDASGVLTGGSAPKFTGDVTYRRPPPRPVEGEEAVDIGRGALVLEGKVEAAADRVLLSSYTLLPDENRGATRLQGAAELTLGRGMAFNAIVSGGVVALPPRDATKELTDPPFEMVRLLAETPLPFIPGIPGTVGLDITELNLRGVSLRNLRLDASTDTSSWTIDGFEATLPGATSVGLTGNLSIVDGHPIFAGGVTLDSQQLDRLAALWRKAPPDNPLFNMPGSLAADVALSSDTLTLSGGTLLVAGINQRFDASIGFTQPRSLDLTVNFTTLGAQESAAIAALLPDLTGSGSFGATFPRGALEVSASRASLFGLHGSELAATAQWDGGVLELSRLRAGDLGGAFIDAKLTAFGTLMRPELSGNGSIRIGDGAPIVSTLLGNVGAPPAVVEFIGRSLPATLDFQLDPPKGEGGQMLNAVGRLGTAETRIVAQLAQGIANALTAPIAASIEMESGSPQLMSRQLGLGDAALFDDRTPLHLSARFEGTPSNSYEVHLNLEGGSDRLAFDGNVIAGDFTAISGSGTVELALSDASGLMELAGAGGVYVPPIEGKGRLQFTGNERLRLTEIEADGVTGELEMTRRDGIPAFSGALTIASADATGLLPLLTGPSGTIEGGDGVWPEGPIDIGAPRASTGRIAVDVTSMGAGGRPLLTDVRFGVDWDAQSISLSDLTGTAGDGGLTLDVKVCCSNPALPAKQITGRVALNGVPLDLVMPEAVAQGLDGVIDASAAFDGTGATLAEAVAAMTGTGSYTVSNFAAAAFDPQTFNRLVTLSDIVDMTPEALREAVEERLETAPFKSNMFTGSFTIAGGTLRSPNLAIAGDGARIFGGGSLRLSDMNVDARYAMSPTVIADPANPVDAATAEIAAVVQGPLWAPVASYDTTSLVDAIKIKASEIELARLEQLRIEDEARRRAAAEDRARVLAEQEAAAAARKAAEEERAQKAAEEAALRAAAEAAANPPPPPQPMDLGL